MKKTLTALLAAAATAGLAGCVPTASGPTPVGFDGVQSATIQLEAVGTPGLRQPPDVLLRPACDVPGDVEDLVIGLVRVRRPQELGRQVVLGVVELLKGHRHLAHRRLLGLLLW